MQLEVPSYIIGNGLPYSPSSMFVALQGIIPWNDMPSHPINSRVKPRRGEYQNTQHNRGKTDNTQSWLFQCQMLIATRHNYRLLNKALVQRSREKQAAQAKELQDVFFPPL